MADNNYNGAGRAPKRKAAEGGAADTTEQAAAALPKAADMCQFLGDALR